MFMEVQEESMEVQEAVVNISSEK